MLKKTTSPREDPACPTVDLTHDWSALKTMADALNRALALASAESLLGLAAARAIMSEQIVFAARAGERDPERLAAEALCHLRQQIQIEASKNRVSQNLGASAASKDQRQPG
jgi:hypothetical protein